MRSLEADIQLHEKDRGEYEKLLIEMKDQLLAFKEKEAVCTYKNAELERKKSTFEKEILKQNILIQNLKAEIEKDSSKNAKEKIPNFEEEIRQLKQTQLKLEAEKASLERENRGLKEERAKEGKKHSYDLVVGQKNEEINVLNK